MTALRITTSAGRRNPKGTVVELEPTPAALAATLSGLPPAVEAWWSPHTWFDAKRDKEKWLGAATVGVDLDFHNDEGKHCPPPPELAQRLLAAARAGAIPGSLFHLTPRGARIVWVFPEQISDPAAFERAAREAGRQVAEAVAGFPGYVVDQGVLLDRARLLYTPGAIVDGLQRQAEVVVMRAEPSVPERRFRVVESTSPLADAVARYNAEHVEDWGKQGSGRCPACGHNDCFGKDPHAPERWYCFSSNHPDGVGIRTPEGRHHGDALDMAAAVARCSPADLLRQLGYLAAPAPRAPADVVQLAPRFRLTDTGNAERLVAQHGTEIRYCHPWKEWLVWDGRRWRQDATAEIERRAKAAVRSMYTDAAALTDDEQRKSLGNWANKSEEKKHRSAMVSLAASEAGVPVLPSELDADAWSFNVMNGTINLRTGELAAHRRESMCTKLAPVWYDADASCALWDRFVLEVMAGDVELVSFLRRSLGYALTADVSAQALFFFYGMGANGKSTFTNTMLSLLGDYGKQAAPDLLLAKHGEAHPTEQADLFGARAVVCQELQQGRAMAETTVKQLTGGDLIKARKMRQDFFQFEPTHKLFIAANHKPHVRGTDEAIWRRIMLVPFQVTIPKPKRDGTLVEKLRAELPGILAWAVRGCLEWQAGGGGLSGLAAPARVLEATQEYREEEDHVGAWLAECFEQAPAASVSAKGQWDSYTRWCEENGERAITRKSLGGRFTEIGFKRDKRKEGWHWIGLRLVTRGDP